MPSTDDVHSLTLLEQAILAQLSSSKPTSIAKLMTGLARVIAPEDRAAFKRTEVEPALVELHKRGFITGRGPRKTELGNKALRDALGMRSAPKLDAWCSIVAARALGLQSGAEWSKTSDGVALAIVRQRSPLPAGVKVTQVGDALLAERLGLGPGPVTLKRLRNHVLAQRLGDGAAVGVRAAAAKYVKAAKADKKSLTQAVARQALVLELKRPRTSLAPTEVQTQDPELLSVVHDAISHVGPDGRVGPEMVFVSAIWQRIAADRRVSNLSLDGFKRWLVNASRDRLLSLARADAVGGMDPRLVADSEIESLGSSFHFVVDAHYEQAARP